MQKILVLLIVCALVALAAQFAAASASDAGSVETVHEPPSEEAIDLGAETEQPAEPDVTAIEGVPDIEGDPIGSVEAFVDAIRAGNWKMVGSLALALIMVLLAKARKKVKFFNGDRGGAILVMLLGLIGGFSAALATEASFDWKLALGVVGVVWTGVGGVQWFKRLLWPKDAEA